MIKKAVILAGGRGTRLAKEVNDRPKPMADIAGLPFLHYLLLDLKSKGITEIVLLAGYMHDYIESYFGGEYHGLKVSYLVESEPRGTGGLVYELSRNWDEPVLLINGDTYFDLDIQALCTQSETNIVMAAKQVANTARYGVLEIENKVIKAFNEKHEGDIGYINGGVYFLPKGVFNNYNLPFEFSLEKDFFEKYISKLEIQPFYSEGYFIDIGIPEDYQNAKLMLPRHFFPKLDESWTLFLDRDGVLNKLLPEDYVKSIGDFEWIDGSKESVVKLSKRFNRILVVTNQQGIGKGIMSDLDLEKIHWNMQNEIEVLGGKIDRVYYCPHIASINPKCRKPNIGMALEAKRDFPEIDFTKSIMIGDFKTDMKFGAKLGMYNIFISQNDTSRLEHLKLRNLSEILNYIN